jgi:excisionase family DNA binding protein
MKPKKKLKFPPGQPITIGDVRIFELRDVAARLQISMNTLRRYVRTGRLAAQKVGVKWMISEDAIREFFLRPYTKPGTKKPKLGQS